jgi:PPK2 family polyphosphate:nucleotide phosphotransferase
MNYEQFRIPASGKIKITDYDPATTDGFKNKEDAESKLAADIQRMAELQDVLYACRQRALLVLFQGMDTAGKDSVIKHVMSGINPQGVHVTSFKQPTEEELHHDYLWRGHKVLPERGFIGIFNRSYYEEVLVARVHREVLEKEGISEDTKALWKTRYEEINNFERYLERNCVIILKFALNLSKAEQKKRLLNRIETPEKNWKFALSDLTERKHWSKYMSAYESMFNHTSTEWAPWYFVPADHKWYTRVVVADVIVSTLKSLNLKSPVVTPEQKKLLAEGKKMLEEDKD